MSLKISKKIHQAISSSIYLPKESKLKRLPRAPSRPRNKNFWKGFEDKALIYDIFWHQDEQQILLVCPPPMNLLEHWQQAKFKALPSNEILDSEQFILRSTMTIALKNAPKNTKQIEIDFADNIFIVNIQPNMSEQFEDSRLLFTMNKDNPLSWIKEWATYYQTMHNANAILFFDNGSSIYELSEIEQTLASVKGIENICVIAINHKYGPHDKAVFFYRFWANFLQLSSFSIMFRRFGAKADAILNADIDEFVDPIENSNVFNEAKKSKDGLFLLNGIWVEGITEPEVKQDLPLHDAYRHVRKDFRSKLNANKWSLDPSRDWLKNLNIHPAVHKIRNAPKTISKTAPKGLFWHFKGINTNWKVNRTKADKLAFMLYKPTQLKTLFDKFLVSKSAK